MNYGKNQVQVRYQATRANTSFTLAATSSGSAPQVVGTGAELATLQTRVLAPNTDGTHATDWGIQVGSDFIQSKLPVNSSGNPCAQCYGFQIVMLNRQDLSVVSNNSYEVADSSEISGESPFLKTLEAAGSGPNDIMDGVVTNPNPPCQPNGCIMIMQSLAQIGFAPCYNNTQVGTCPAFVNDSSTVNLVYWITKLGASGSVLYANGASAKVGYSFVGNAGSGNMSGPGAMGGDNNGIHNEFDGNENGQFERLGCLDTTFQHSPTVCDSLGRGGSSDNAGGSSDPQQAGRISGVLIRDNYNLFTFAQNAPQMSYTFGTTLAGGVYTNVVSINGGTAEGAGQYTLAMPSGSTCGFRLLILDRTHPDWADAKQWDKFYNFPTDLHSLETDILNFPNANGLFFLASMGNITHDDEVPSSSQSWEALVEYLEVIGADPITVRVLGDRHPAFSNGDGKDDYLLIGKTIPYAPPVVDAFGAGGQARYTAEEAGYVINRHTLTNATSPTQVEGVLVPDNQGYYTPHMQGLQQGLMVPQIAALSSASLQAPVPWPYSSTTGQQNAYTWISEQLCCSDIRATYINLNASPAVWLTQLDQLSYTDAPSSIQGSDFDDVKLQLGVEFEYLQLVRNLQDNILSLYQDQQSNVALILDQAASDIKADVDSGTPPPTVPTPWSTFTSDVFPVLSNLAGFYGPAGNVAKNALGIGTLVIDNATQHVNDPSGVSQTMHALANEEIAEADVAQHEADQYADSLAVMGNDFKRIVTDWGRLKAVGGPISSGQLIWDPSATAIFLRAFDLTTRRQFYPLLMHNNPDFFVTHIQYADDHYYGSDDDYNYGSHDYGCSISVFHQAQDNLKKPGYDDDGEDLRGTAWWPGVLQQNDGGNRGAYWWDIWALGDHDTNGQCPPPCGWIFAEHLWHVRPNSH